MWCVQRLFVRLNRAPVYLRVLSAEQYGLAARLTPCNVSKIQVFLGPNTVVVGAVGFYSWRRPLCVSPPSFWKVWTGDGEISFGDSGLNASYVLGELRQLLRRGNLVRVPEGKTD